MAPGESSISSKAKVSPSACIVAAKVAIADDVVKFRSKKE
jgi:hypothetical protein